MDQWPAYPEGGGLVPETQSGERPPIAVPPQVPDAAAAYVVRGYSSDNPLVLAAGSGTFRKSGEWLVPPFLLLKAGMGTLIVDMQRAHAFSQVISVDIGGGMGRIVMIIPVGWSADVTSLNPGVGSKRSTVSEKPTPGFPILYFTGTMITSSLVIRYPSRRDEKRMSKQIKREEELAARAYR